MYDNFDDLIGCRITAMAIDGDEVRFTAQSQRDETVYTCVFCHSQDCCESVSIHESSSYDGSELIGCTIESVSLESSDIPDLDYESGTCTNLFLEYETVSDYGERETNMLYVVWHGYSNGYYGEGITASITTDGSRNRW